MFEEVEARLQVLNGYKPFAPEILTQLDAVFEPWFIYGSNAIEGNTLTLGDTIYLIREGKLPAGKREEEYLEVKGQQAAYAYLREAVAKRFELSEMLIREFHTLLTNRLDPIKYGPGQYKDFDNQVKLSDGKLFPYVSCVETPAAMQDLVTWFRGEGQRLHPIERAAALHYRFILIHPFRDGNGRTARLLTNLALLLGGHVMAVFRADERRQIYLDALRATDRSVPLGELAPANSNLNLFPFTSYVEQELLWSYDLALDVVQGKIPFTSDDVVRRFERLEQRRLEGVGISADEQSRLKLAGQSVQNLTERVALKVKEVVTGLNRKWTELKIDTLDETKGARDLLERPTGYFVLDGSRMERLGLANHSLRGQAGLVALTVRRGEGSLVQLDIPPNTCEFIVRAEPHALTLASIRHSGAPKDAMRPIPIPRVDVASIGVPLDPKSWRMSEIDRFVFDEINHFLEAFEGELQKRNAGSPSAFR